MATTSRMDLTPYGIRVVLRKGMSMELENLVPSKLAQGSFSQSQGRFDLPSGSYSLGPELGRGMYGITYQAIHAQTNHVYAIKVETVKSPEKIGNMIKESIINILLEKESEHQPDGPYVPRFYEMAYDPVRQLVMLRIERLQGTVSGIIPASTHEQNDVLVPQILGDVAHILNFFHKSLRFNHRDLKSNNVGYVIGALGKPVPKLIDFGFSCITWKGVQISGAGYFPITDPCYIPSRDLMQFVYELLKYDRYSFSARLQAVLEKLLTFPLDNKTCKLFEGCSYKHTYLRKGDWEPLYDFLNNRAVHNPHTEPQALHRHMLEFLGQAPTKHTTPVTPAPHVTAQIKHCLPEQILNPRTRRCVRRSGKVGRLVQKQTQRQTPSPTAHRTRKTKTKASCKAVQARNPVTGRCRYSCPSTYIRDPATQRCVSRQGPVGRKLVAMGIPESPRG